MLLFLCSPEGLPHCCWTPKCGGPHQVKELLLSPAAPQGCQSHQSSLYISSPFPPSHCLRIHAAGGGLSGQRIRPGISAGSSRPKWAGKMLAILPSDPLPSQRSPPFPSQCGIPSPTPAAPQGHHSCPASTSPPPTNQKEVIHPAALTPNFAY